MAALTAAVGQLHLFRLTTASRPRRCCGVPSLSFCSEKRQLGCWAHELVEPLPCAKKEYVHVSHVRVYGGGAFPYVELLCGTAALPTNFRVSCARLLHA